MAARRSEHEVDGVVAAIERVLEAERAAEFELARCRERAQATLAAARARAAAITARADARISGMHTAYLRKMDAEIASAQACGTGDAAHDDGEEDLQGAAVRLAAELTGGDREPPV